MNNNQTKQAKHITGICSLLGHICTFHSETSGPVHIKATLLVYMLSKNVLSVTSFQYQDKPASETNSLSNTLIYFLI